VTPVFNLITKLFRVGARDPSTPMDPPLDQDVTTSVFSYKMCHVLNTNSEALFLYSETGRAFAIPYFCAFHVCVAAISHERAD